MKNINCFIIEIKYLTQKQKIQMFNLMTLYYADVNKKKFYCDLNEKNWVLLVCNNDNVVGFTTIKLLNEGSIKIIYSGDTIIDEKFRGGIKFFKCWFNFIFNLKEKFENIDFYWFLISKGYRTYKLLPLFFKNFYPRYKFKIPKKMKQLLDFLGIKYFGNNYDNNKLIIYNNCDYLRSGINDINQHKLNDPNIKFFLKLNPDYHKGNELCCIAKLNLNNLTKTGLKIIENN